MNFPGNISNKNKLNGTPKSVRRRTAEGYLSFLAKFFAALIIASGILLYFIGYVSHVSYLEAYGVDIGSFPKGTYEFQLLGATALLDFSRNTIRELNEYGFLLPIGWLAIAAYFWLIWLFSHVIESRIPKQKRKPSLWLEKLASSAAFSALAICAIPVMLATIAVILSVPFGIAKSQGKNFADNERLTYARGCESLSGDVICQDLLRSGKKMATGYVIDSSQLFLAFFDTSQNVAHVLERKDLELITHKK